MLEVNGEEQEDGENCTLRSFVIWNLHQDDHIKADEMDAYRSDTTHSRTPLFRINLEGKPFENAGNPVNWIFLRQLEVRLLLFTAFACV